MKIEDIIENWDGSYFQISPNRDDDFVYIYSEDMERSDHTPEDWDLGYKEFFRLEDYIKSVGRKGWVARTDVKNDHIMLLMASVGAKPFNLVMEENAIYFVKRLGE